MDELADMLMGGTGVGGMLRPNTVNELVLSFLLPKFGELHDCDAKRIRAAPNDRRRCDADRTPIMRTPA